MKEIKGNIQKSNIHAGEIIGRLEEYVARRGDKFAQLTVAIGVSVGYFSRMRKVKGSLGAEVLARILMYYSDLSADWLLTGQGTMLKGYPPTRHVQTYAQRMEALKEMGNTVRALKQNIDVLRCLTQRSRARRAELRPPPSRPKCYGSSHRQGMFLCYKNKFVAQIYLAEIAPKSQFYIYYI